MKQLVGLLAVLFGFTFIYDTTAKTGMVYINRSTENAVFLIYPGNHCVMFSENFRRTPEKCDETLSRILKVNPQGVQPDSWIIPAQVPK